MDKQKRRDAESCLFCWVGDSSPYPPQPPYPHCVEKGEETVFWVVGTRYIASAGLLPLIEII